MSPLASLPAAADLDLVVFDMAGTIVDHGCFAPILAFQRAFASRGVDLTIAQARGPMGLGKLDHIRALLALDEVRQRFGEVHGRRPEDADAHELYDAFLPLQTDHAVERAVAIEGAAEAHRVLRSAGARIAWTTGYPRVVTDPLLAPLAEQGLVPDVTLCADEVPQGRPAPDLIRGCMERLDVTDPARVVKCGDTRPDMEAARAAGVAGVGVVDTGSELGLEPEALAAMGARELGDARERVRTALHEAGATACIGAARELPALLGLNAEA